MYKNKQINVHFYNRGFNFKWNKSFLLLFSNSYGEGFICIFLSMPREISKYFDIFIKH